MFEVLSFASYSIIFVFGYKIDNISVLSPSLLLTRKQQERCQRFRSFLKQRVVDVERRYEGSTGHGLA